jgi:hypothetical protein
MEATLNVTRYNLPLGSDRIPVVVAHDQNDRRTVLMEYDAFLELWATLFVAVKTLKESGIDPEDLAADDRFGFAPAAELFIASPD